MKKRPRGRPRAARPFNATTLSDAIQSHFARRMNLIIKTDVLPKMRRSMEKNIQETIYDKYEPSIYSRRENAIGGLLNPRSIVTRSVRKIDKSVNQYLNYGYNYHLTLANIAKPVPLREWSANMFYGSQINVANAKTGHPWAAWDDILYYWKDQGLVHNYFGDPRDYRWTRPTHTNEAIERDLLNGYWLYRHIMKLMKDSVKSIKIN